MTDTVAPEIDGPRLLGRLAELGAVGATGDGGVSRLALTDADAAGRDLVVGWMREIGLEIHVDPVGNVIGLLPGRSDRYILTGSHIDTVATGGRYDGNLGVLAGLEAVQRLQECGFRPGLGLGVAFFTNEEGARFAPDMLGSLAFTGHLPVSEALQIKAIDGPALGAELQRIGYGGTSLFPRDKVAAFVELHIEQGPVLEAERRTIGVVQGVQGIRWLEFEFSGEARHAGTTPMDMRRDAGAAAFSFAAAVLGAFSQDGAQMVTVGRVVLDPNLVNVVARRARLTLDLRNIDGRKLADAADRSIELANEHAARSCVSVAVKDLVSLGPVAFDRSVMDLIRDQAQLRGHSVHELYSGAGHDAQIMARICPAGMIFVPSVGGVSHNPREFTTPEDIIAGANVLTAVLAKLAQ